MFAPLLDYSQTRSQAMSVASGTQVSTSLDTPTTSLSLRTSHRRTSQPPHVSEPRRPIRAVVYQSISLIPHCLTDYETIPRTVCLRPLVTEGRRLFHFSAN